MNKSSSINRLSRTSAGIGSVGILLAVCCFFLHPLNMAVAAEPGPVPRMLDAYGDSLPPGASARLGSVRLQHFGLSDWAILDKKTIITVGTDGAARWWDLESGRQIKSSRLTEEKYVSDAKISQDGARVAVKTSEAIQIIGLKDGKILASVEISSGNLSDFCLSPDGSLLAMGTEGTKVILLDWHQGLSTTLKLIDKARGGPENFRLSFSGNGKQLLASGVRNEVSEHVIDVDKKSIKLRLKHVLAVAAISRDSNRLAIYENHEFLSETGTLWLYDANDGKKIASHKISLRSSGLSLAASPDGRMVAVKGGMTGAVIDAVTGKILFSLPGRINRISFSQTGNMLVASDGSRLRIWDVNSGRELHDRPQPSANNSMSFYSGSRLLAVDGGTDLQIGLWDVSVGKLVKRIANPRRLDGDSLLSFADDGQQLRAFQDGLSLVAYDIATGKAGPSVAVEGIRYNPKELYAPVDAVFSSDGEILRGFVLASDEWNAVIWSARTGRILRQMRLPKTTSLDRAAFSADQTLLAMPTQEGAALVDTIARIPVGQLSNRGHCSLSPNGALVAVNHEGTRKSKPGVHVHDVLTGQELFSVPTKEMSQIHICFAPRLRAVLVVEGSTLQLIDLLTGAVRGTLDIRELRDGERVKSWAWHCQMLGGHEMLIRYHEGASLVWDLRSFKIPERPRANQPTKELAALWEELGDAKAARAQAAVWAMTDWPAERVVEFLRSRVIPAGTPTEKEITQILSELSNANFARREKASKQLEDLGRIVLPRCWEELQTSESAEAKERIESLIKRLSVAELPARDLRIIRAIHVLEYVDSPSSRQLLEELAAGPPYSLATKTAKTSLGRTVSGPK